MQSRGYPNYGGRITSEDCKKITKEHRNTVINIMSIFSNKLEELLKQNNKNREIQQINLENLVEKVCGDVAKAIENEDYEQNKKRYENLPYELVNICKNTFNELRNFIRKNRELIKGKTTSEQYKEIVINIFSNKLKNLGNEHDKDKDTPENLKIYTHLLNNPGNENLHKERKKIHNYNNTHHVEGFLECDKPKLQYLVEMVCDNVATAMARKATYRDIFKENKERYMQKGLTEKIATICANTFIDLWNNMHTEE